MNKDDSLNNAPLPLRPAACLRDPEISIKTNNYSLDSEPAGSRGQAAGRRDDSLPPKVIILMATYNGERYLTEQLDSICAQTHQNWEIWISDDGSSDKTLQILNDYQARLGTNKIRIHDGPHKGFSANFLSLVCKKNLDAAYYAYCDQDDIWTPNKLQRAIDWLTITPDNIPALYCGRTHLVNETGNTIGYSPIFKKKPSFLNAIIQNIGGGNTMVFNKNALNILQEAGDAISIVAHDWWTYQVVTGSGGVVFYDPQPALLYRQHDSNLIGGNLGWYARFSRLSMLFKGRFQAWNNLNFKALLSIKHRLTDENQKVLDDVLSARKRSLVYRLIQLKTIGIYRQTFLGNIGLMTAAFFNKI